MREMNNNVICEERKKNVKFDMNMCDVLYNCENSSWCFELSHIFFHVHLYMIYQCNF